MNTPYEIADLEDYLYDRMSPADRMAFQMALEADTLLSKQLEALRVQPLILEQLQETVLRERLTAWKARYDKKRRGSIRNIQIGLAAIVACSALLFLWWRQEPGTKPLEMDTAPIQEKTTLPRFDTLTSQPTRGIDMVIRKPETPLLRSAKLYHFIQIADSLIAFNKPGQSHMGGAGTVDSMYNQALLLSETNVQEALSLLQQSANINPENANVLRLQAYILYSLGQNEAAAKVYAQLKNIPNSLFHVDAEKAEIACYLGLMPDARKQVDSLLNLIINAREGVSNSRKNFARKLLYDVNNTVQ